MSTDVSSVSNHFPKPQDGFTTTTSGSISSGATTVGLNSTGSYSNGDIFVGIIEPGTSGKEQTFTGVVDTSGVQITGVKWTRGTNTAHAAGVTVVDYVSATHLGMMSKGLLVQHKQDGTHANTITTDTINENTPGGGVTVDSLLIKDGYPKALAKDQLTTDSNPYKFGVYRNAAQNAGNAAFAKINFDTELFDTNNNFDSTTNYRYTAPITGFYRFTWAMSLGASSTDTISALYKNGSTYQWGPENTAGGLMGGSATAIVSATAGDYFEIFAYSSGAQAIAVGSAPMKTYFYGELISKT